MSRGEDWGCWFVCQSMHGQVRGITRPCHPLLIACHILQRARSQACEGGHGVDACVCCMLIGVAWKVEVPGWRGVLEKVGLWCVLARRGDHASWPCEKRASEPRRDLELQGSGAEAGK